MKKKLLAIILLIMNLYTYAQDNTKEAMHVTGKLVYANNNAASFLLISAYNSANKVERSALTNHDGGFTFTSLKAGNYFIGTINGNNKILNLKTLTIDSTSKKSIDIGTLILDANFSNIKEVVVTGVKPYVQRKLDRLIVNVENNSLLAGNTINEMLPKLPSISLDAKNNLTVNGKSGVVVLIDGKGQLVSKEQVTSLLENMKAESVEKVEIISNPPVKYDANGAAVINIVTKKNKVTSDVHTSFGQQISPVGGISNKNEPYYAVGTNLNYTVGKVRLFTMLDYTYAKDYQQINDVVNYLDPLFNKNGTTITNAKRSALNTRFGFNTDLSKTLSFDGTFTFNIPFYRYYNRRYQQRYSSARLDSVSNSVGSDRFYHNRNNTVNLRLNKKLNAQKNEEIALFFDYNDYAFQKASNLQSAYYRQDTVYRDESYLSFSDYSVKIYSVKTDYSISLNKTIQLEAGAKATFINNSSNFGYDLIQNSATTDSTQFKYHEVVTAAYLNLSGSVKSFDYQFGGRLENTSSTGKAPLLSTQINRSYLNFFPAFTLQYNIKSKEQQALTLSYNRRIVRPGYDSFNPNQNLGNRFSATTGNPYLNPQFLNNFELSYNWSALNITLSDTYYKNIKDVIPDANAPGIITANNVVTYASENDLNLNIGYQFSLAEWWTWTNSFNGSHSRVALLDGSYSKFYNYDFSTTQSFSFDKINKLDVRFFYRPDQQITYGRMREVINLTAGYRTSLIQNRLSMAFNVNDILGRNKLSIAQNFGPVSNGSFALRNDRYYRLTLRYTFKTGKKFSMRNQKSKNDNSEIRLD